MLVCERGNEVKSVKTIAGNIVELKEDELSLLNQMDIAESGSREYRSLEKEIELSRTRIECITNLLKYGQVAYINGLPAIIDTDKTEELNKEVHERMDRIKEELEELK